MSGEQESFFNNLYSELNQSLSNASGNRNNETVTQNNNRFCNQNSQKRFTPMQKKKLNTLKWLRQKKDEGFSSIPINNGLKLVVDVTGTDIHSAIVMNWFSLSDNFILPFCRQLMWSSLFTITVVVGTLVNGLVIWVFCSNKNMRTVTNYPLVNLSISDALNTTLNTAFNFYAMLHNEWIFGHYCKFGQFISSVCISASVFTLMAISIDRYLALVVDITRGPLTKRTTLIIGAAIWAASSAINIPAYIIYSYHPGNATENYNIGFSVITYIVPIGPMAYCYTRVGKLLWRSERIGEYNDQQLQMVLMMIVVVILFGLSWPWYQIYFVIGEHYPELYKQSYAQEVYLVVYWLAMSHSVYHPIIYWCFLKNFRNCFNETFTRCCRWCWCKRDEIPG